MTAWTHPTNGVDPTQGQWDRGSAGALLAPPAEVWKGVLQRGGGDSAGPRTPTTPTPPPKGPPANS